MSASLPPFSGLDSLCPKCGAKGLRVRFLRNVGDSRYGTLAYRHGSDIFPCMERKCVTCDFEALEAPLSQSDALTRTPPVESLNAELARLNNDDDAIGFV